MFLRGHFFLVLILAALLKAEEPDESVVSVETLKPEDDVAYLTPNLHPDVYFADHFDDEEQFKKKWIKSQAKKAGAEESIAKYDGEWSLERAQKDPLTGDLGLVMKSKAKHAAISAPLGKIFKFDDKPFIVQYELNFQVRQFYFLVSLQSCHRFCLCNHDSHHICKIPLCTLHLSIETDLHHSHPPQTDGVKNMQCPIWPRKSV